MSNPTVEPLVPSSNTLLDVSQPLRGRVAQLAHAVWWICVGLIVAMTIISIPLANRYLHDVCTTENCNPQQPSADQAQALAAAGISLDALAASSIFFNLFPVIAYLGVALVLFLRKPDDKMVYLTSLSLAFFGGVTNSSLLEQLAISASGWGIPFIVFKYLGSVMLAAFFFTFPNGKFVPHWFRWVWVFWVLEEVFDALSYPPLNLHILPEEIGNFGFVLILLSGIFSQGYRYLRVSTPAERQQTKWVLFGIIISLSALLLFGLSFFLGLVDFTNIFVNLGATVALSIAICAIPVSIGIAILRSHLWDLDFIINRTLVYGALTAILAGILAVSSDLTKRFFLAVTGETSDLAPILATLIVVAAFDPIRSRLSKLVDRHFKYATGSYGAFGDQLNTYVQMNDPDELARRFLTESIAMFDAGSGAVYLGRGAHQRLVKSIGTWDGHAELAVPLEHTGEYVGLVALGARKNGGAYSAGDRATLQKTGDLVAHAILLSPRVLSAEHDVSSHA